VLMVFFLLSRKLLLSSVLYDGCVSFGKSIVQSRPKGIPLDVDHELAKRLSLGYFLARPGEATAHGPASRVLHIELNVKGFYALVTLF